MPSLEKAQGVDIYPVRPVRPQGGQWVATIRTAHAVKYGRESVTLMADAVDYVGIFTGKVNPMAAFGEGKIKLKGDIGLAMKLMNFFKMS
jgi:sterol carrier protein 2